MITQSVVRIRPTYSCVLQHEFACLCLYVFVYVRLVSLNVIHLPSSVRGHLICVCQNMRAAVLEIC